MPDQTEQYTLLRELEPVVETNLNRHQSMAKEWHPHDYVPWSDGENFAFLGGVDWDPEQSKLDETAKVAMVTNLLTEDNLPSYHREIATNFTRDGAWGSWIGQWTAEEGRHAISMRDYLVVTRGVDPVDLERQRMAHMTAGYDSGDKSALETMAYVSFQELATRVSHRNTGRVCNDPVADQLLARVAADENLHMIFYRNLMEASLDMFPDLAVQAVAKEVIGFEMPGAGMDGFARKSVTIAKAGIYDLRQHHDEVIMPILRKWKILQRDDFTGEGARARDQLGEFMTALDAQADRFTEQRERAFARQIAKGTAPAYGVTQTVAEPLSV